MRNYIEPLESRRLLSSIDGIWVGTRTEAGLSGTFETVTISLDIEQSGRHVWGTEVRSSPADTEYFADLLTHGSFADDTFYLQDEKVTADKRPADYEWLLYSATLKLSADGKTLTGSWHGGHVHGDMTLHFVSDDANHHRHRR